MTRSELTHEQAQRLLAPVGDVVIVEITVAATTNDVFKVVTRDHGNLYVKLHTARWYADQPDTFFVVNRECAVPELLRKRGMALPYRAWGDYTRGVVGRSAYICGELAGTPVPQALARFPRESAEILRALGHYMRRLHSIEFSNPGLLEPAHALFCEAEGTIPRVEAWHGGHLHHPEHMQREALDMLQGATEAGHLHPGVSAALDALFQRMASTLDPDYHPPRFTVGNCHAWHFHTERVNGHWTIFGFYDFEAASAGDPTIDLVELEMTLVPSTRSFAWRDPFYEGYGHRPTFEGYKMRVLYYLLYELGKAHSRMVPDPGWQEKRWMDLAGAGTWQDLTWFPIER